MKDFNVSLIQMNCSSDNDANVRKAVKMIGAAAEGGADMVCLQELFCSTYFPQEMNFEFFNLSETIPGETVGLFQKVADKHKVVLILPVFEKVMEGLYYNSVVVIGLHGEILGKYRKMHIPDEPYYYEKYYFKPGDLGYPVFETPYAKIGVGLCWDQWFPETGRILALNGAEVIFFPTAIGRSHHGSADWTWRRMRDEWLIVNKAQASMNKVYVVAVNRVGAERHMHFFGNSIICNPVGEAVEQAGDEEGVLTVSIEASIFSEARRLWPFFRDRRPNSYGKITAK